MVFQTQTQAPEQALTVKVDWDSPQLPLTPAEASVLPAPAPVPHPALPPLCPTRPAGPAQCLSRGHSVNAVSLLSH